MQLLFCFVLVFFFCLFVLFCFVFCFVLFCLFVCFVLFCFVLFLVRSKTLKECDLGLISSLFTSFSVILMKKKMEYHLNHRPPKGVVATPCDFSKTTFLGNRRLPNGYM